jgi:hypothetical protein
VTGEPVAGAAAGSDQREPDTRADRARRLAALSGPARVFAAMARIRAHQG